MAARLTANAPFIYGTTGLGEAVAVDIAAYGK
jgi:hypothetical protein